MIEPETAIPIPSAKSSLNRAILLPEHPFYKATHHSHPFYPPHSLLIPSSYAHSQTHQKKSLSQPPPAGTGFDLPSHTSKPPSLSLTTLLILPVFPNIVTCLFHHTSTAQSNPGPETTSCPEPNQDQVSSNRTRCSVGLRVTSSSRDLLPSRALRRPHRRRPHRLLRRLSHLGRPLGCHQGDGRRIVEPAGREEGPHRWSLGSLRLILKGLRAIHLSYRLLKNHPFRSCRR